MKRCPTVILAHNALQNPCKAKVKKLLASVNLTLKEKEIIIKSELRKIDIESICNSFDQWDKKTICSYAHAVRLKRQGMLKIGRYIEANKGLE